MDLFKRMQYRKKIGPGGINCGCCVDYPKKRKNHKKEYRKYARRKINYYDRCKNKLTKTIAGIDTDA